MIRKKNKTKITADYAISYSNSDLIDLRGNVVVSTHLSDTLISDQLYYDRGQEWLFTNYNFRYVSLDKDIYGKGFDSDKSFEKIKFLEVNGFVSIDE
jgi:LPS export ABC transporter protein LptC